LASEARNSVAAASVFQVVAGASSSVGSVLSEDAVVVSRSMVSSSQLSAAVRDCSKIT
jgi:hypothetical protein